MDASPTIIHTESLIPDEIVGLLKMASTLITLLVVMALIYFEGHALVDRLKVRLPTDDLEPIYTASYTPTLYPDLGTLTNPQITVPVSGQNASEHITFTVDSGAVISALPSEYVKKLHLDLTDAKRIILNSLTTKTVFGYIVPLTLQLDDTTIEVPTAVADISTPVLGRYGFFDQYTLIFDHQQQSVTIAKEK